MMRRTLMAACFLGIFVSAPVHAQDVIKLKFSHWVIPGHPVSQWIQKWADQMREKSGGKIQIDVFANMQLGGAVEHYDMVRRGTADIGWILHGYTSDRFPLTTLFDIPFTVDDPVTSSMVMDNKELRAKYFDPEARGVKNLVLFTNQPTHLFTANRAVRSLEDAKGLRIRYPSATAKRFVEQIGASPAGIPAPQLAENLQKGVIDGVMTDYGAVGISFKLGGLIKYVTELKAWVSSFAFIMNPDAYAKLTGPNKELFDQSFEGAAAELGRRMASIDEPGKKIAMDAGMQVITLSPVELAKFHAVGAKVATEVLDEREKAGVPARVAYAAMQKAVADLKK